MQELTQVSITSFLLSVRKLYKETLIFQKFTHLYQSDVPAWKYQTGDGRLHLEREWLLSELELPNLSDDGILSKNLCFIASPRLILSAGSYSNIFTIRSNRSPWSASSTIWYLCNKKLIGEKYIFWQKVIIGYNPILK